MQDEIKMFLGVAARHGLTTLGGVLVHQGLLAGNSQQTFVASGMVLAGILWSLWQKYGMILVNKKLGWAPADPPLAPTNMPDIAGRPSAQ